MSIRYYKKSNPRVTVQVSNAAVRFQTLDGQTGYFATTDEGLQAEFQTLIEKQIASLTEISPEEFSRDFVEPKKNRMPLSPLLTSWSEREEFGKGARRPLPPSSIEVSPPNPGSDVAAANRPMAAAVDDVPLVKTTETATTVAEVKPNAGSRARRPVNKP